MSISLKPINDDMEGKCCKCSINICKNSVDSGGLARIRMHCASISGILPEYGNTVGDSLIVPYLLLLGSPVWITSYVWILTPLIDSWMQIIYGKLSDKYTSIRGSCCGFGGRKPFILLFGIFATLGLIIIPQSSAITDKMYVY